MPMESFEHDLSRHRSYDIDANWALVDNYLGFSFICSRRFAGELDYESYRTELFEAVCYKLASPVVWSCLICLNLLRTTVNQLQHTTTGYILVMR